jgi:hypothetical protein
LRAAKFDDVNMAMNRYHSINGNAMTNEKYAVVFDTNSYRNLIAHKHAAEVEDYIEQVKIKEARKNIVGFGTTVVGMEMLANLAGAEKSSHYEDCLKGLIAMANHCFNEQENVLHVIPHPYIHITQNFFDVVPPVMELRAKNMAGVIGDFKYDYAKAAEYHGTGSTCRELKNYIDDEEPRWVSEINYLIEAARQAVLKEYPEISDKQLHKNLLEYIDSGLFVPRVSMAIIFGVANSLGIQMNEKEHPFKGYFLPQVFPFSVRFYQWVCHRIVEGNIDMQAKRSREKRWNWRWDYEVSFLINDNPISDRQLLLVTSDRDMIRMLQEYGYEKRVMDLTAYLAFLNK